MGRLHYLLKDSPKTGTGDLLISVQAIEPLLAPIPNINLEEKIKILFSKINIDNDSEKLINDIFYELYDFDYEEIEFIESLYTQ